MSRKNNAIKYLRGAIVSLFLVGSTMGASAQEPVIEMSPERATAEVAPVQVTLEGMPGLPRLPLVDGVLESVVVRTEMTPAVLPVPAIPREMMDDPVALGGEQVFFNATLGGGSVSTVLGSINVFRIGEGPEFRIGYDHRASDGFNFEETGSGFFRQENRLETWVRVGEEENLGFEAEVRYGDERFGLQGLPRFYSAETRELSGMATARYRWDTRSSTELSLNLRDLSRVLAVASTDGDADPPVKAQRERYFHVGPVLSARLEWPRLALETALDYSGRFADGVDFGSTSTGGVSLRVEGVPLDGLTLTGMGATRYRWNDRPYFPVELGLEYSLQESWNLRLAGGYRVREQSYGALWGDYPVAAVADGVEEAPPVDQILFGSGDSTVSILPGLLQFHVGGDWFSHSHRLIPGAYDENTAVYPVDVGSFEQFRSRTGLSVTPTERIRAGIDWNAEWLDRDTGVARHRLDLSVRNDWDNLTTDVSFQVPFDGGEPVMPILGGALRYGIARDVELRVFVSDVLAPLEEDGRTRRGRAPSASDPFIEPGFEAGAAIRVSF